MHRDRSQFFSPPYLLSNLLGLLSAQQAKQERSLMVMQLIYASRPFGFDDLALTGILATARKNNVRDGITGALICREDLYLQLLEGGADAVLQAFARIQRDDRHTDIVKLWSGEAQERLFPDWAMRHDQARSWMWTAQEVSAGAVTNASADDVRSIFRKLSNEPAITPQL